MELAGELRRIGNTMRNHPDEMAQVIERLVHQRVDVQFHPYWDELVGYREAGVEIELILSHTDARPAHHRAIMGDLLPDFADALTRWSEEITAGVSR